jgi:hypothetical protein
MRTNFVGSRVLANCLMVSHSIRFLVETRVVVGGFDPVDVGNIDSGIFCATGDKKSSWITGSRLQGVLDGGENRIELFLSEERSPGNESVGRNPDVEAQAIGKTDLLKGEKIFDALQFLGKGDFFGRRALQGGFEDGVEMAQHFGGLLVRRGPGAEAYDDIRRIFDVDGDWSLTSGRLLTRRQMKKGGTCRHARY